MKNQRIILLLALIVLFALTGCKKKIEYVDEEHIFGEWIDEVKKLAQPTVFWDITIVRIATKTLTNSSTNCLPSSIKPRAII